MPNNMKNNKSHPDKDSMMALQALLKIRSDSIVESSAPDKDTVDVSQSSPSIQPSSAFAAPAKPMVPQHFLPVPVVSSQPQFESTFQAIPRVLEKRTAYSSTSAVRVNNPATPPLNAEAVEEAVRKDKIQAALRSKPQRGRKRENLSVLERLELTRTRNREHAKSTRIRKKARYQELEDKELKYEEMKRSAELELARVNTVHHFIRWRSHSLTSEGNDDTLPFLPLVHDSAPFKFDVQGLGSSKDIGTFETVGKVEARIRENVNTKYGNDFARRLRYTIVGGSDSIAISKSGVAVVQVAVGIQNGQENDIVVMSVLLQCRFAAQSPKLTSVSWTTIADLLPRTAAAPDSPQRAREVSSLSFQKCYPSVVSLDHGADNSNRGDEGPGMNI